MERDKQIERWLSGELSPKELKEFESSVEFAKITRLLHAVQQFKAPEYPVKSEYSKLKGQISKSSHQMSITRRILPVLRIAAMFIVALGIGYFAVQTLNSGKNSGEWIVSAEPVFLPDSSVVTLNAESSIRFSEKKWNRQRDVELKGEAFFQVSKGSKFHVSTDAGIVSVLGTEFSVADRKDFFQVTCYSGIVKVQTATKTTTLQAQSTFRIIQQTEEQFPISTAAMPEWMSGESRFKSVPLHLVLDELERQYAIEVDRNSIKLDQLFTGSFTHSNLELALETIMLPMNLGYEIKEDQTVRIIEID